MTPTTKEVLKQVEQILAQAPEGLEPDTLHLPLSYTPYISAILERWPHLVVRTGSKEMAHVSRSK